MSKNTTVTASKDFELTCTECAFETTVEGTFLDALDVADDHEAEYGSEPSKHFVDVTKNVI